MSGSIPLDSKKFKNLLLYISGKYSNQKMFGALKLNKALFLCDFYAYGVLGKSITGATYTHLPKGPAPSCLVPIRTELISDGSILLKNELVFGKLQHRVIALREADLDGFSPDEIALIDDVLSQVADQNGTELSDLSHRYFGWKLTSEGEEIPYHSIFLSCENPTLFDFGQAKEIALTLTATN